MSPQVRLETPPISFSPQQIAVFPSGGCFLAGWDNRANQPTAAVHDAEGHLVKQLDWRRIGEERPGSNESDDKAAVAIRSDRSIAITGDDGFVYFMRAIFPPSIYVISSAGEIVRKLVVKGPTGTNWPGLVSV